MERCYNPKIGMIICDRMTVTYEGIKINPNAEENNRVTSSHLQSWLRGMVASTIVLALLNLSQSQLGGILENERL